METLKHIVFLNIKKIPYGSIFIGLISAFFVYKFFHKKFQLPEGLETQLKEIQEELEENNGELTFDISKQIVELITRLSEKIYEKSSSNLNQERRNALAEAEKYFHKFQETLMSKENALIEAQSKIFSEFGKISEDDIQTIIRKIPHYELESITEKKFDSHILEGNNPPEKNLVKEAFRYYSQILKKEIEIFSQVNKKFFSTSNYCKEDDLIEKVFFIKLKCDDELYIKFKLSENQMRYLLKEYQMFDDSDVRLIEESISKSICSIHNSNF